MKSSELKVFVEIARTGGVRAAATQLSISQSAVTKALQRLEEATELTLFTRTNRGLHLTEAGEKLLPAAQSVIANMERTERIAADLRAVRSGNLRIAIAPTVPDEVVAEALSRFRSRFPETSLTFSSGLFADAAPLLLTDKIDLALIIVSGLTRTELERLTLENLFTVKYGLVARRDHPFFIDREVSRLCVAEWLSTNRREVAEREIEELTERLHISRPRRITCCDLASFSSILLGSNAISLSPLSILERPAFTESLTTLLPDTLSPAPLVGAFASRRDAELSTPALYMKHVLRSAFSDWFDRHKDAAIEPLASDASIG